MSLFVKKPLSQLLAQAADTTHGLKRTLGPGNLIALGVGAIIGAGLFVRTAAAASEAAGPAVTISFMVAAVGCVFAGLCYAEFAAMIPIAGSAYTYAYATLGEIVAWIIGWALIMEYALGATTVAISWTEYLNKLLGEFGTQIPYQWSHSPFEHVNVVMGDLIAKFPTDLAATAKDHVMMLTDQQLSGLTPQLHNLVTTMHGTMNIPSLFILLALSLLLIKGTAESAVVNSIIVALKVTIVLVFIVIGWGFINPANQHPYIIPEGTPGHDGFFKYGIPGILGGASIVFFAFIGFDAVSTAAQEAKNPKKHMPIGILGSLVVCTVLYILFSYVLTGVANWREFGVGAQGHEASVAYAIKTHMAGYHWLATAVTVAILLGFSSVILVMLLGQSRVFYSMANDGLLPKAFSDLHPKFRTPYKSNLILFVFAGTFAAFIPESVAGDLTSFGTLFAFVLVSLGVLVMRKSDPGAERPFRAPWVPFVPIMGILVCGGMIIALDKHTLIAAFSWMIFGLIIYFVYSKRHSKLQGH